MSQRVMGSIQYALIAALALGPLAGEAQERDGAREDIHNVLLTFHLIQADGFTDQDPEISDVVSELRNLFNFRGYRLLSTSVFNVGLDGYGGDYLTGYGSQRIYTDGSDTALTIVAEVSSQTSRGPVRAKVTLTDKSTRPIRGPAGTTVSGRPGTTVIRRGTEAFPLLEASVTIRDGQRVVLGSARRTADEPVLILVVTPRIDP